MAGKNTSVFGIYPDRTNSVEEAIDAFKAAGFRNTDISVLLPENVGSKDFAHEKHTKAPEGAATGATSGAVIGGTLGWLAGIGALTITGQPNLSWRCWPVWERLVRRAELPGDLSDWECQSTRPGGRRAA